MDKKLIFGLPAWLYISLLFNFFITLALLVINIAIASLYPNPSWISYINYLSLSANLVFIIFLFILKKWAFFAFCGSAIISFIMSIIIGEIGVGVAIASFWLAIQVILCLLIKSEWDLFK